MKDSFKENKSASIGTILNAPQVTSLLVVEDDLSLVELFGSVAEVLRPHLDFYYATSGEDALKMMEARQDERREPPFDLVITDIFLSGEVTGLSLWVECSKRYPDMPMMVTSSLPIEDYMSILSGFVEQPAYVPKPLTTGKLKDIIEEYL